jgi:hypothetical protein
MDMYSNLAANGGGYAWDPEWRGAVGRAIGGFQNFADTGGFSEQDKQDMRARAIAPTRAVFQNAMNEARRGQALSGGSPNFNSALSRMARQNAYAIGDMNTNANAALAEMVQQGKLAGLGGMSSTGLGAQDRSNAIDSLNAQMKLAGLQGMQSVQSSRASAGAASDAAGAEARLAALGGMRQLYGTNPALLATTGDQLLNSDRNLLGAGELSNNFGGQTINARLGNAQVPGNFQSVMGNIGSVMNAAGAFVNPLGSLLGGGSGNYSTKPYYGGSPVYGASTAPWERTM